MRYASKQAPGAFDTLIQLLRTRHDVGIVSRRVHFEDGRLQPLFLGRFMPAQLQRYFSDRIPRYDILASAFRYFNKWGWRAA